MNLSRKKGPLYSQIKGILKDRILHGIYPLNTNIPPEPQLESEFQVSKVTIRKAIEDLTQEGYLEKKSGKGTRVIRNNSTSKLSKGKLFTEFLVEEGNKVQKQLLQINVIRNQPKTKLYQLFGEKCICIERLYYLNNVPYIHFTHYLTIQLESIKASDVGEQSLYELIEEQGIVLEKFQDQFTVSLATPLIAEKLKINADFPLLKRFRYSYDEIGILIEYGIGYYNANSQHYVVNYEK